MNRLQVLKFSVEHIEAVNRRRRIVVNYDVTGAPLEWRAEVLHGERWESKVASNFAFADMEGSQIDSIFWCFEEGNDAAFPSKFRPVTPYLEKWVDAGQDIMKSYLEETKNRGLEAFYSYRMNGIDCTGDSTYTVPMKTAHPDWLLWPFEPRETGYWNYAIPAVRAYRLSILREVAEKYNYDGIDLDFARLSVCLPPGHQWENRHKLTEFIHSVRTMLLEVEKKRGRPFLLSARVPENIKGCHFDGMDVETWARERLVDIFILGCRSLDVDIATFRRIIAETNIKLYPCFDEAHSSDGYKNPPIEVFRGVAANWWEQEADGVCTFNFYDRMLEMAERAGIQVPDPIWMTHQQCYLEVGSPKTLKGKDKIFPVERRGGGHWMIASPQDWRTPRAMYFNTNMFAPLPAKLANDGKADTLLMVRVADDLTAEANQVKQITIYVLLSDPAAEGFSKAKRFKQVMEKAYTRAEGRIDQLQTLPLAKRIDEHIELRLNNILLPRPMEKNGWLVFNANPGQFAVGNNLVGLRVSERPPNVLEEITVEKLEVHVKYR